jgi:predicted nucleic acid-binding protein
VILVDTSVWIDHFHSANGYLLRALDEERVLMHPFVIGELACGSIRNRRRVLDDLMKQARSVIATEAETLRFLDHNFLMGKGLSYIDVHLLAAARLEDAKLYTRDKSLREAAVRLGVAYTPA